MTNKMKVPNGWRQVRLGEVAEVNRSNWNPVDASSILYLDLTAVVAPGILAEPKKIAVADAPSRARRRVHSGDILVSTVRPNLRGFARIGYAPENLIVSTGFAVLTPLTTVDCSFIYHHVMANPFVVYLGNATTGQAYPAVRPSDIENYRLPLPSLEEQRAIAAVLDSIDEAIERTDAVIAAKEQLRDSLLHELLTHGVPGWHKEWKEVRGLGTVPACWDVVRLGDVTEVNPRRPPLMVEPMNSVTFVPMAAIAENCGGIVAPELRPFGEVARGYTYFQRKDVLFAKITPCLQNGKHALAANLFGEFGFGTTEFHVIRTGPLMDPRHLFRVLTQPSNLERCQKSFSGTAGQQRVHPDVLRELRLCRPPLDEQRAIAGLMDRVDMAIEGERQVKERLQSLKDSTADALLTGRVQIQKEGTTASAWDARPVGA